MAFLAPALKTLRNEIDAGYPGRPTTSDGWIGDRAHSSRTSDHNPDRSGRVDAIDVTGEPGHEVAERLRVARDQRIKYCISRGRMWSSYAHKNGPAFSWRPYSGSNRHDLHAHFSIHDDHATSTAPWGIASHSTEGWTMRQGHADKPEVTHVQHRLKVAGFTDTDGNSLVVDGDFGGKTTQAVNKLRASGGLSQDGTVNPIVLDLLRERLENMRADAAAQAPVEHEHPEYAPTKHGHQAVVTVS